MGNPQSAKEPLNSLRQLGRQVDAPIISRIKHSAFLMEGNDPMEHPTEGPSSVLQNQGCKNANRFGQHSGHALQNSGWQKVRTCSTFFAQVFQHLSRRCLSHKHLHVICQVNISNRAVLVHFLFRQDEFALKGVRDEISFALTVENPLTLMIFERRNAGDFTFSM